MVHIETGEGEVQQDNMATRHKGKSEPRGGCGKFKVSMEAGKGKIATNGKVGKVCIGPGQA